MSRQDRIALCALALLVGGGCAFGAKIYPVAGPVDLSCPTVAIQSVLSVRIERQHETPMVVASGLAATNGGHNVMLRFKTLRHDGPQEATVIYDFVGCVPPATGAGGSRVIVVAATPLLTDATIRRVVVEAATNEAAVDLDAPKYRP